MSNRRVRRIRVVREWCKGCYYCIEVCPGECFTLSSTANARGVLPPEWSRPDRCVNCGMCALFCPDFAIEIEWEL
ncbi:ferredoxin family protein [archaeon]|nr:ferredoxin family protein [archaeon]